MKYNPGERVWDTRPDEFGNSFLGRGTVVKYVGQDLYLVNFDFPPPKRYNMGENPTVVFGDHLRIESDGY